MSCTPGVNGRAISPELRSQLFPERQDQLVGYHFQQGTGPSIQGPVKAGLAQCSLWTSTHVVPMTSCANTITDPSRSQTMDTDVALSSSLGPPWMSPWPPRQHRPPRSVWPPWQHGQTPTWSLPPQTPATHCRTMDPDMALGSSPGLANTMTLDVLIRSCWPPFN